MWNTGAAMDAPFVCEFIFLDLPTEESPRKRLDRSSFEAPWSNRTSCCKRKFDDASFEIDCRSVGPVVDAQLGKNILDAALDWRVRVASRARAVAAAEVGI